MKCISFILLSIFVPKFLFVIFKVGQTVDWKHITLRVSYSLLWSMIVSSTNENPCFVFKLTGRDSLLYVRDVQVQALQWTGDFTSKLR